MRKLVLLMRILLILTAIVSEDLYSQSSGDIVPRPIPDQKIRPKY